MGFAVTRDARFHHDDVIAVGGASGIGLTISAFPAPGSDNLSRRTPAAPPIKNPPSAYRYTQGFVGVGLPSPQMMGANGRLSGAAPGSGENYAW